MMFENALLPVELTQALMLKSPVPIARLAGSDMPESVPLLIPEKRIACCILPTVELPIPGAIGMINEPLILFPDISNTFPVLT